MAATPTETSNDGWRVTRSFSDAICRRAFSSPEALAYESTIAPALAKVVVPVFVSHLTGRAALDVGCGGGEVAEAICRAKEMVVVGLDPSASQIRRVARRSRRVSGVVPMRAGAEQLPFRDDSFDAVLSSCAWKHWTDHAQGVAECIRVTKPGGAVVLLEIDGTSSRDGFWQFAKSSRVPLGMRGAYVRFAMRTVVGVAPSAEQLVASFGAHADHVTLQPIPEMPFNVAVYVKDS